MSLVEQYLHLLQCPNTGQKLQLQGNLLQSQDQKFSYRVLDDNFIELLPDTPYEIQVNSQRLADNDFYHTQLTQPLSLKETIDSAWGIFEQMPRGYRNFIRYEQELLQKLFIGKNKKIAIDVAGGVGTHTFELAKHYELVIHCDLWDNSLNYAYNKAKELGITNILFIRADYFHLPFQDAIADLIISIDSFDYYSVQDDLKILKDCQQILHPDGFIFCDLHNKKGIFDNHRIHEYTAEEISELSSHFEYIEVRKFCRMPATFLYFPFLKYIEKLFFFVPFVRWVLIIKK